MGGALHECFIKIQKLVFLPFQRGTGMRTFIVIGIKLAVFMYYKNRLCFTFYFELEAFTARVFDVAGFAENVSHNVC